MRFQFRELTFAWPLGQPVIETLNLSIAGGERLAILGGNGSGKTTLARCLGGRLACSGSILCDGKPWADHPRSAQAAMVQSVSQQPHLQLSGRGLTLREEIAFGPENLGLPAAAVADRVDEATALLNLTHLADRDCRRLSGGETQRTILAGALAMRPDLLILDEPMTDLDAETRNALVGHLQDLPWDIAVIFFDIGWHDWMNDLIESVFVLQGGRLNGPFSPSQLPGLPLPAEILLPRHDEKPSRKTFPGAVLSVTTELEGQL